MSSMPFERVWCTPPCTPGRRTGFVKKAGVLTLGSTASRFASRCRFSLPSGLTPNVPVGLLPLRRLQACVVVRTEPRAQVIEREEPNACTGARRRDEHDEVPLLGLEAPVSVRARARVAERPTVSRAPNWKADRCMLNAPSC